MRWWALVSVLATLAAAPALAAPAAPPAPMVRPEKLYGVAPHVLVIPDESRQFVSNIGIIMGARAVMGGVANISATIAEPGVIRQTGTVLRMVFGELDGSTTARAQAFAALCARASIDGA